MLGDGDRRSLYVIAALADVGWTGDRQQEGEAVAAHLGLDWNEAQHQVERIHRSTGIAPRSGRYRYISPYPLAVYLAREAWESYPDLLKSLPEALPSDGAREAYYRRLESLAGSPQAQTFARDQLRFFFGAMTSAHFTRHGAGRRLRRPIPMAPLATCGGSWRCGATDPVAIKVAELLRVGSLDPGLVGQLTYGTWTGITADALHGLLRAMIDTGHGKTAIGVLRRRMEHAAAETDRWRPLALELITDIDLVRHASRHWQEVAELLIADHPREIAAAIIRAHAHREASTSWLLRYQQAATDVFRGCLRRDAGAVWRELAPYLWPPRMAAMFVIGFPAVLEDLPRDDVLAWIAEAPSGHTARRAALLAGLTNKLMLTDDRLAARIIADYGDHETVDEAFFGHQVSGAFTGPASRRWQSLAEQIDRVAADTGLPGLRRWARRSADALHAMVRRERQHEEERELLVRAGA